MIIVEGPDGAGKSTLIEQLSFDTGIPIHEKAAPHSGPNVQTLWEWTHRDMANWGDDIFLYDRHPLVSEYIYGPVTRGRTAEGFDRSSAQGLRNRLEDMCLLILCLPPYDVTLENVHNEEQMEGVVEHHPVIYQLYATLRTTWHGWLKVHDYTNPDSYSTISMTTRMHAAHWRRAS